MLFQTWPWELGALEEAEQEAGVGVGAQTPGFTALHPLDAVLAGALWNYLSCMKS